MACNCLNAVDAQLFAHNTRLVRTLKLKPFSESASIRTEKINTRNRELFSVMATYCPFCGVAYEPKPARSPLDEQDAQ